MITENNDEKQEMTEEQRRVLDEAMAELDMMLEMHEKFKEEYGKRYEGLTPEEREQEYHKQLLAVQEILDQSNMKVEYFSNKSEDDEEE